MRTTFTACGVILLLCCADPVFCQEPLKVENRFHAVTFDQKLARFSVQCKPSGKSVVVAGKLSGDGGTARATPTTDKTFGKGDCIEVTYPSGNRDWITLFPELPFVVFQSSLHNKGTEPVVLNHVRIVSAGVDLGKPAADLRTLGTGGLLAPEKNSGSYAFLTIVDPEARAGIVGGWLTHDRGSGVVFSPVEDKVVRMEGQIDYGRLRILPGKDALTEKFALGFFEDARFGLEAYADAIVKVYAIKLPPQPSGYCTWYADKHAGACDEKYIQELSSFAAENLKPFGFDFVQIDDGWQDGISKNGPRRNFMNHNAKGPYPSGMKTTADNIRKTGLTPGIWFMPFAGTFYDPFFQEHQDWFAKDKDGKPFETRWGGTCLDLTVPAVRAYLQNLIRQIAHAWGFLVFKMDGLWTGTATRLMYVNNGYKDDNIGEAILHDPDKTHIEAFRDGLKLVREAAGPKVYLLGCCVSQNMRSFGGAFGLLDGMRVGPDTGAGHIGAPHGSRTWFLHGRVWQNDPDCVSVRTSTPLDQARVNATFTAISGQLFYNSDWMPDLPAVRLDILKRTIPAHGLPSRPVDVFEHEPARIWLLTDTRGGMRRDVVTLYNWEGKAAAIACPATRVGLPAAKEYVGFDFWGNRFVPPFRDTVQAELSPASCLVLAVRPVSPNPQLLSTSRHVTQGIVDVTEEKWDPETRKLSGTSQVVAKDPYELRIIVPVQEKSWRATGISIAAEDTAASVATQFKQDGPKLRVTLTSPTGRTVKWQVQFEPAKIEAPTPAPVMGLKAHAEYHEVVLNWEDSGADRYEITRNDGTRFTSSKSTFTDTTMKHGQTYRYSVAAIGWNGTSSTPATAEVTTPAELKRPPVPPTPDVHLSDLKPVVARNGHGKAGIDKSAVGKTLRIDGKQYQKGLGLHANALFVYRIPAGAQRFVAVVGLDDEKRTDPRQSITCEVYGDVKELGEAPVLLAKTPLLSPRTIRSWTFDVPLNERFKELRLVVTDAGDGIACDHADWVDAGFINGKK